jgi:putative peptidoglycan lipid II flippase
VANDSSSNIIKNTSLITLATLGSRITGLVRTWAMAFALGNTVLASAYNIAYNMPAMIYELAASGILATAFLPLYLLQKEKNGDSGAQTFASNILTLTTIILGLLALACSIFSAQVIETQTFAGGDPAAKEMAIFFFRVFAVQILLYGLGAVITGILNAERSYMAPSLAPILNNIVVIVTMFGFVPLSSWNPSFAMWWLAVGTSVGVLFQFGAQIPALVKRGVRLRLYVNLRDPMLVEALKVAAPMFLYIAGTMITFSCKNAFALQATPNGPATLNYAWMWYQLPYGVIAVSLGTTLLTELSDCAARDDWPGFRKYVSSGLRNTFFLMIPLAAMVCGLAFPLMQMFQAGAFSAQDTQAVGIILMFWTLSLPFYAGYMYMYRVFAAMRKFVQFALVDFALRFVQVFFYWFLCSGSVGLAGIPITDFFFYGIMFIACSFIVRSKVGSYGNGPIVSMFVKTTIASAIAGAIVFALSQFILGMFPLVGAAAVIEAVVVVVVCGVVGLIISFVLCKVFRVPEYRLLGSILSKFKNKLLHR